MVGLQPTHLLIIVLVGILFFVPSRLPKLVRGFKQMFTEYREEVKEGNSSEQDTPEARAKPSSRA